MRGRARLAWRPGDTAACILLAAGLTTSAVLIIRNEEPVSTCVRTRMALRFGAGALGLHLIATLPFDPLTRAGDRLERWYATRVPSR